MNYIKPLLTLSFWFDLTPPPLIPIFQIAFFALFITLFIGGLVCSYIQKKKKDKFLLRFGAKYLKSWFYTVGLLGLLWLFFSYERAAFFSAKFWLILLIASFGIWLFFIIKKIKALPEKQEMLRKKEQFEKYLPKKNNKK